MKKWFENFWYYYKWHTIIGVVILVCVLIGLHAASGNHKPDLQILLMGEECGNLETDTKKMSEVAGEFLFDVNGDGTLQLACRELKMTGETDNDMAMIHQLIADFSAAESQVYLTEKEYIDQFIEQEVLRPLDDLVSLENKENGYFDEEGNLVAVKVTNDELLSKMGIYIAEDTYLGLRVESNGNENAQALFKQIIKEENEL